MPIACTPFRAVSSSLGGRSLLSAAALIPLHRVHWLDWLRSGHVWPRTKPAPYQSPSTGSFPAHQQNMNERNWLMIASVLKSDIKKKLDLGDFKWLAVSLPVCRRSAMRAWLFRHQPQGRGPPPNYEGKDKMKMKIFICMEWLIMNFTKRKEKFENDLNVILRRIPHQTCAVFVNNIDVIIYDSRDRQLNKRRSRSDSSERSGRHVT